MGKLIDCVYLAIKAKDHSGCPDDFFLNFLKLYKQLIDLSGFNPKQLEVIWEYGPDKPERCAKCSQQKYTILANPEGVGTDYYQCLACGYDWEWVTGLSLNQGSTPLQIANAVNNYLKGGG